MNTENHIWAIDSGSLAPGELNPKAIAELTIPSLGTPEVARRLGIMKGVFEEAGIENPTVSVLPAVGINVSSLAKMLEEMGMPISSLDVPYIFPPLDLLKEGAGHLFTRNLNGLITMAGFSLLNTYSREMWEDKTGQLAKLGNEPATDLIFRTSSDFWGSRIQLGESLLNLLKQKGVNNPRVVLEIMAGEHSIEDYYRLIARLRERHPEVNFGMSFDTGHMAQAVQIEKGLKTIDLESPQRLIKGINEAPDLAALLFMVELDQINSEGHTHLPIFENGIDLTTLTKTLPQNGRRQHIVIEHDPRDFLKIAGQDRQKLITYLHTLS